MYEIIKHINDTTKIAESENRIFILKKITLDDAEIYKRLMAIDNEHIAKIYELAVIDNDFYAVEQFIQGETLEAYVGRKGCLSNNEVKRITCEICDGLSQMHRLGLVHRDITPSNVMIDDKGCAKLIDFGISRIVKSDKSRDTTILGTQGFAAPEQFGFQQTSNKSDIYSLGVLMNYMKTQCLPHEMLASGELGPIISKCLEIDDKMRFQSVGGLANALSGGNKFVAFIQSIPGFRQGIWWHIMIAVAYYLFVTFMLVMPFIPPINWVDTITTFVIFVLMLVVPVPVLMNYRDWADRAPFVRNLPKANKMLVKIALVALSYIVSFTIILLYHPG